MPPPAASAASIACWIAEVESVVPVGSAPYPVTTSKVAPGGLAGGSTSPLW